jgi:hypothetical protein
LTVVDLFENPVLAEVAKFVEHNRNVGPRWTALHKLMTERVLPAGTVYRAALDAAAKEKAVMEARHADLLKARESHVEQIEAIDRAVAVQLPAERAAAEAAPAKIAAEANAALTEAEVSLVSAAIQSYMTLRV